MINAKVITDSISSGIRLATLELYYPLMIHGQLMTHRVFSRNAQSNRAMPVDKMLEQVRNNPAMPSHWGKNQAGMQAYEELEQNAKDNCGFIWADAADNAMRYTRLLQKEDLHKQVANRLTMPFQYIKVIVTATEWDNFFKLRLNDADPTHRDLAKKMKQAMDESEPTILLNGEWHLPYLWEIGSKDFECRLSDVSEEDKRKISAARCARVSYNNHNGTDTDIQKDIDLANRLLKDGHMSPFEHVARPMTCPEDWAELPSPLWARENGYTHWDAYGNAWSGNFRGFIQYRQLL